MKKLMVFSALAVFACGVAFSQQITRFGVVDTSRVYAAYFRNSAPVRNYENKKADFQNEINKRTDEIQKLQRQKLDYQNNGDDSAALRVEAEIAKKTDNLTQYTNAKNIELESLKTSLQNSDAFYRKLYSTIERVAEHEGFSMILSLQQANAILWYSSSVDVTDKVISELGLN